VAENIVEIVMLQIGRHYTDVDDNDVDVRNFFYRDVI